MVAGSFILKPFDGLRKNSSVEAAHGYELPTCRLLSANRLPVAIFTGESGSSPAPTVGSQDLPWRAVPGRPTGSTPSTWLAFPRSCGLTLNRPPPELSGETEIVVYTAIII